MLEREIEEVQINQTKTAFTDLAVEGETFAMNKVLQMIVILQEESHRLTESLRFTFDCRYINAWKLIVDF